MRSREGSLPDPTVMVSWVALPLQFFVGGAVLGVFTAFTLLFGSGEDFFGGYSVLGALLFGSLAASVVMLLAFVVGLPFRLVRVLRWWWVTRGWIIAIIFAVVGLLGVSLALSVPVTAATSPAIAPNYAIYLGSMGVAALGLCHLMRPMKRVPLAEV